MADNLFNMLHQMNDDDEVRNCYIRAPFGYPGSKDRSLEQILPKLPYRNGYCEPFGGTGCVLLARKESKLEIFNDRYAGIVALYRVVRDREKLERFLARLELCLHSREEFVWSKETWKDHQDDVERAARWYYMMCVSFGSKGKQFGRCIKGRGQVGKKLTKKPELFWPLHHRLRNVQIENLDWRLCLKDYDSDDMVWYLDPPYYGTWSGTYIHEFQGKDEHIELLNRIQHLQGFVAVSSYQNELYDSYKWDEIYEWEVYVSIVAQTATETNNLIGKDMPRGKMKERLYIRSN